MYVTQEINGKLYDRVPSRSCKGCAFYGISPKGCDRPADTESCTSEEYDIIFVRKMQLPDVDEQCGVGNG